MEEYEINMDDVAQEKEQIFDIISITLDMRDKINLKRILRPNLFQIDAFQFQRMFW